MKKKTLTPLAFAIAACSYGLPVPAADTNDIILQLTPAGKFQPADGRAMSVPNWYIDQAVATKVIERFNARNQPVVIDYEHQTLRKEENGQPAPAAAWMRELIWQEGKGLFARVELTTKARTAIAEKEYLYVSPVFRYAPNGDVTEMEMAALTNTPALHGMQALELRAAATFGYQSETEEPDMKLLPALIALLSMQATATEDEVLVALNAHFAKDPLKGVRDTLGLPATAGETELVAACTSLKNKNPDPVNFVSVAVVNEVKQELAVLTQKLAARDAQDNETILTAALTSGRVMKGEDEKVMRELSVSNPELFKKAIDARMPLAALTSSQTNGQPPVKDEKTGLTKDELAVCSQMGISPEEYLKAKE